MEEKKISLDIHENTKVSRLFQLLFGIVCLVIAVMLLINLIKTGNHSTTSIIVVAFLFLFGIWELLASAGITVRYIAVTKEKIILKDKYIVPARDIAVGEIKEVEFKPLSFTIYLTDGTDVRVRLGNYYSDRSIEVLETIEHFSRQNSIAVKGIDEKKKEDDEA